MNLMRYNTNHSISVLFEIEHTTKKILFNVFLQRGIWGSRSYVAGSQSKCDFKYNRQECIYIYILIKFSVTCVKVLSAVKTEKKKNCSTDDHQLSQNLLLTAGVRSHIIKGFMVINREFLAFLSPYFWITTLRFHRGLFNSQRPRLMIFQEVAVLYDRNYNYKNFITVCTQRLEFKHVCFLLRGGHEGLRFLREVDERPCGKWGVNCVAPVLFRDQNESHSLLLALIAAVFQSP